MQTRKTYSKGIYEENRETLKNSATFKYHQYKKRHKEVNGILTTYDWIYGVAQFAAAFLAVIAVLIALTMFRKAEEKPLKAWKFLLLGVIFFAVEEVVGALETFGVLETQYLTHVIPGIIIGLLITALVIQTNIARGWLK